MKNKIYYIKDENGSKDLSKKISILLRFKAKPVFDIIHDHKRGFIFTLPEILTRKLKLMDINKSNGKGKWTKKLIEILKNSKSFDSIEDLREYKGLLRYEPRKKKNYKYEGMPSPPKKDNQKDYEIKYSRWNNLNKSELIEAGNKIKTYETGYKVRKPRKSASKSEWKKFLEKYDKNIK